MVPFQGAMLNFGGVVGKEPLLMFCFDSMDDSELHKSSRNALGTDGILIVFLLHSSQGLDSLLQKLHLALETNLPCDLDEK